MGQPPVIAKAIGLNIPAVMSQEAVGNILGLSKQRIQQIEVQALKKLNRKCRRKGINLTWLQGVPTHG